MSYTICIFKHEKCNELNESEALIIKNLLSEAIENFMGLSEPQENLFKKLNSGVNQELALEILIKKIKSYGGEWLNSNHICIIF